MRPQGYVIGPGDVVQVIVWGHPELTIPAGQFRDAETSGQLIGEDGYLYYPYVGMIRAAGMNIPALRDVLTERLTYRLRSPRRWEPSRRPARAALTATSAGSEAEMDELSHVDEQGRASMVDIGSQ